MAIMDKDNTRVELDLPLPLYAILKDTPNRQKSEHYVNKKTYNSLRLPELARYGRGYGSINTNPVVIEDTKSSYKGPFVEDQSQTIEAEEPLMLKRYELKGELPRKEQEDTWLSSAIAPSEDELEAARNGMRWHWALENRFMPPGSKWNETVWNGVDRENKWLAQMLSQRVAEQKNATPIASERQRSTMANMWKTFLSDIRNGHFDAYGGTTEGAKEWAKNFRARYNSIFGEGADVDLAPEAEILGKRSDVERKQAFDIREGLNYTENVLENLATWSKDGSWKDQTKQGLIKNYLDKVSQSLAARLGGDSKSMADAEKIRIQILTLPDASMDLVKQEIANYRDFLSSVMDYGRQKGWSQNIIGKINRAKEGLDMASKANGKGNISTLAGEAISTVGNVLPSLTPAEKELAVGLESALNAGIEAHKTYMQNMTLAADVNPAIVYQFAKELHDLYASQYNYEMETARRPERAKTIGQFNVDLGELSNVIKPSELLTPTNYKNLLVELSRPESAGGNPQANIEQKKGGKVTISNKKRNTVTNISEGDLL